jgi:hypothetical protein
VTVTRTPTRTHTVTRTPTRTPTRTSTPIPVGPDLTYVGVANLLGVPIPDSGFFDGRFLYQVAFGHGFFLIVEAKPGPSGRPVATTVFNYDPDDPAARPALQIQPNRALGANPTTMVCDDTLPLIGGVPAVPTPSFEVTQPISDVMNDWGCRFTARTSSGDACTGNGGDSFFFVKTPTRVQFCNLVGTEIRFPSGDTLVTVRALDTLGNAGIAQAIIIRVP